MTRRTQRLYEQRRRAIVDARQQELLDDAARLRTSPRRAIRIDDASGNLVEVRRRRRRNRVGQYVLDYELADERGARGNAAKDGRDPASREEPAGRGSRPATRRPTTGRTAIGGRRWVSVAEYERILAAGRVVETRCKRKSCNRPSSGTRDASSSDDSS
jgi:hypothetical protein